MAQKYHLIYPMDITLDDDKKYKLISKPLYNGEFKTTTINVSTTYGIGINVMQSFSEYKFTETKGGKHYYNLILEFYKLTNVPILFNTSFNLAGDTIVETVEDALNTLRKSQLEYLYLPEIKKLIYIKNE